MNCYRDFLSKYEGKEIIDNGSGVDIFFGLRSISMCIACGKFKDAFQCIESMFYENLVSNNYFYSNIRDGECYSNVCDYVFKPIFSGRKFRSLLSHGEYLYSKECHNITSEYLKYFGSKNSNICAVTALTKGLNNRSFFHSFLLDYSSDMVYDFANNIIMPRSKYYSLIVMDEINIVNYMDYVCELKKYSDSEKEGLANLLFLGLVKLREREKINFY